MQDQSAESELPEFIRDFLDTSVVTCLAINPFGTLLAVGLNEGAVQVWDIDVLSLALTISITSSTVGKVEWSADGHFIVVANDQRLTLCKILSPEERYTVDFESGLRSFSLNRNRPEECVVSLDNTLPILVNLRTGMRTNLPDLSMTQTEMDVDCQLPLAVFDKTGSTIFYIQSHSLVVCMDSISQKILDIYKVLDEKEIIGLMMCHETDQLVVYLKDSCPVIYKVHTSNLNKVEFSLQQAKSKLKLKREGGSCLRAKESSLELQLHLQHPLETLNEKSWETASLIFRPKPETAAYIACSLSPRCESPFAKEHLIHIWDLKSGKLIRVLEGPKEGVLDLCWHAKAHTLLSLSSAGKVYLWSKRHVQSWSAFAPGFQELEENEEYVESETEFDLNEAEHATQPCEQGNKPDDEVMTESSEEIDIYGVPHDLDTNHLVHLPAVTRPIEKETEEIVVPEDESLKIRLSLGKPSVKSDVETESKPSTTPHGLDPDETKIKLRFKRK